MAQIAIAVFGDGSAGFFIVQTFTALILILAANTAYQDFPRLASILARDRYMPSQFVNRGDRLVFSNGVIVLGFLSCLMIYAFDAELSTLINFYVVGVFTSFTFSQSGMVRHWLKEGRKGRVGDPRLASVHRHQRDRCGHDLRRPDRGDHLQDARRGVALDHDHGAAGPRVRVDPPSLPGVAAELARERPEAERTGTNHVILLVPDLDAATAEALGYVRGIRQSGVIAVYPAIDRTPPADLMDRWRQFAGDPLPLEVVSGTTSTTW